MRVGRVLALLATAALLPGALAAQSYGAGSQSTVIGAAAFVGQDLLRRGSLRSDGYLYEPNFQSTFLAPVALPDGAVITQICLYSANLKRDATLQLQLQAVKLASAGQGPGVVPISGTTITADFVGYNFVCTGALAYTVRDVADLDGDQVQERIAHRLSVAFTPLDDTLGLGGVRILWHRQISRPLPVATFGDVPTSHAFFKHVEALAASGITVGCGNGNFCPDSPLTREQMAVFLSRALGLHWPF